MMSSGIICADAYLRKRKDSGPDGEEDDGVIMCFGGTVLFCLLRGGVYDQIRQQVLSCMGGRRDLSVGTVLRAALWRMGQDTSFPAKDVLSACCSGRSAVCDRGGLHHQPLPGQRPRGT